MIATDFKRIPLRELCKHEGTVLRNLDSLAISYAKNLLDEPEIRYPFLYYALLTHWPEVLDEHISVEDRFYNRYYWLYRLLKRYQAAHDFDVGFEQQAYQMIEAADHEFAVDLQRIDELDKQVNAELVSNQWEPAVSFSEFSIGKVTRQFGIQLDETGDYFAGAAPTPLGAALAEVLRDQIPLGLAIGTEKARSEYIVAPILAEVRRQLSHRVSVYSGIELDVDPAQGLRGQCDFLLCKSPHQLVMEAPIVAVVEAKKEDFAAGIGQCLAEMVAARIFNQQNQTDIETIGGIVTTGSNWKFLRLIGSTAYVDASEYHIKEIERIVGIIVSMFGASAATAP
jgi:hypothetical protein